MVSDYHYPCTSATPEEPWRNPEVRKQCFTLTNNSGSWSKKLARTSKQIALGRSQSQSETSNLPQNCQLSMLKVSCILRPLSRPILKLLLKTWFLQTALQTVCTLQSLYFFLKHCYFQCCQAKQGDIKALAEQIIKSPRTMQSGTTSRHKSAVTALLNKKKRGDAKLGCEIEFRRYLLGVY